DQLFARLGEHLDLHVIRDFILIDQETYKVKIRLRGGRETNLDFLETELHQMAEHAQFALMAHRLDQRLVAIAKVNAAPDRRLGDHFRRPLSVRQIDRRKRPVFFSGVKSHFSYPFIFVSDLVSPQVSAIRFDAACIRSPGAAHTRATAKKSREPPGGACKLFPPIADKFSKDE